MSDAADGGQPVVVVTGGGAGIGAAVAEELGRQGWHVVTLDPMVTLDGAESLPAPEETTAGRIVGAGGSAQASAASVTDRDGVRRLFESLVEERGRLDAVINVAGITRPTGFAKGSEADWRSVLAVHLDGYLNVLGAALPIMAAAGRGAILGVTSGSGWRPANTGAYGCAKRSVASLTWQLGAQPPPGVVINAVSPIAVTRMVTAALGRIQKASKGATTSSATGGLSLGSMPEPEELGPFCAHLVDEGFSWCSGQVFFAGGSEVAVLDPPRLLEVVRADDPASLAGVLEAVTSGALAPAEADQASKGGSNPRFSSTYAEPADELPAPAVSSCVVVSDDEALAAAITAALDARGVTATTIGAGDVLDFDGAAAALTGAAEHVGGIDGVVVALPAMPIAAPQEHEWQRLLAEHADLPAHLHRDGAWARAVADYSAAADRRVRLVTLTDAATSGGRSRAQAAAHHSRSALGATEQRVAAFAVSVEAPVASSSPSLGEIAAHLLGSPDAIALSGAELAAGDGWFGLRSHPRPAASITLGGRDVPAWLDDTIRDIVGAAARPRPEETP